MIEKAPLTNEPLDVLLELFEERWRCGEIPRIEDFLPPESDGGDIGDRREALLELLMIDLERRWRLVQRLDETGADPEGDTLARETLPDRPLLDDYVRRFPELGAADELPLPLIADEYRVRCRWGDQPDHESYLTRFRHSAAQPAFRVGQRGPKAPSISR